MSNKTHKALRLNWQNVHNCPVNRQLKTKDGGHLQMGTHLKTGRLAWACYTGPEGAVYFRTRAGQRRAWVPQKRQHRIIA